MEIYDMPADDIYVTPVIHSVLQEDAGLTLTVSGLTSRSEKTDLKTALELDLQNPVVVALASMAQDYLKNKQLRDTLQRHEQRIIAAIMAMVNELKQYIREALDEVVIRDVQARVQSAFDNLRAYGNATGPSSEYRLQFAEQDCRYALNRLQPFGLKAFPQFFAAANVYFLVLVVRTNEIDRREIENVRSHVELANRILGEQASELMAKWDRVIAGVSQITTSSRCGCHQCDCTYFEASFTDNGMRHSRGKNEDSEGPLKKIRELRAEVLAKHKTMKEGAEREVVVPIAGAVHQWRSVLLQLESPA
ncbi:hypothetical protein JR065_07380 [Xanthomonas sp. AmX2]|uniref:hypothetical protein n=1 Tax=Xanthomonas sp. TaxID=29446 RepID=UPI0019815EC5|nr:hypothetical protein [Xanthomonas sp.]MBN6150158.1 hypothetical protein [Xanthomonas sp.]